MAICYDEKRKVYYISYKTKINGEFKSFNIKNKNWSKTRGKKYMKMIEEDEIEKDKRKRQLGFEKGIDITFGELINKYEDSVFQNFKYGTAYAKKLCIHKHMTCFSWSKTLSINFTINNIEKLKTNLRNTNTSVGVINKVYRILREIISFAEDREYITTELAHKMNKLLKPIKSNLEVKEKLVFWNNDQWQQFINSFDENDKWKLFFETAYICGLRIGEILALKWNDFNAENKTLTIDNALDCRGVITTTKNISSNSFVSINDYLRNKLVKFKADMFASDDNFIFFIHHTSRTTIRRVMDNHIKLAGLPHIKFHGLRHSCASRLINAGASPLLVSKHLRHASVSETLNTYSHLFTSDTSKIIDDLF